MSSSLEVSFLPWAEINQPLSVGPVRFWRFATQADREIQDNRIRDHLTRYFRCYVNHDGEPVDTVTVCSHGHSDFRGLSDQEHRDLRRAVDAVIFATIAPQNKVAVCADNRTMGPPSSNVFELLTQGFLPGSDDIAIRAGSTQHGGWKIGQIVFPKPWEVGGPFGISEKELLEGLGKCFHIDFPADIRERIFRSLEWFRLAHVEGGGTSWLSKVVMMTTAFEILLQFPRERKRQHFVRFMEDHIASSSFLKDTRTNGRKTYKLALVACWAWDFYEVRSRIVHGDLVPTSQSAYRGWVTHLIVADLVFWECLTRELFNQQCIGDIVRACAEEIEKLLTSSDETSSDQLLGTFLGYDEVHKALGWIT